MRSDLIAISFTCAALLAIFIPVARVRCNVANLAIVAWLVGCNLVHGIDAVIWNDNADIRVPVWCDIVTKFLLGASVAISGAFICISARLELVSSGRPIPNDPRSQSRRIILEFVLCYIAPLVYMALHLVAQDHRFDLLENYGCSASVHPSGAAIALVWTPPLPWLSWASVHADIAAVKIVQSPDDINSFQLSWWGIPAVSMVYIFLSFILGEEARDAFRWICGTIVQISKWRPQWNPSVLLPTHVNKTETEMQSRSQLNTPRHRPQALDLRSGWDEMLDTDSKKSKKLWSPGRRSPSSLRTTSPIHSRTATPSPSPTAASPTVCGHDEAFMTSTLEYLGSPTAKSLGIIPPALVISPPPVHVSPRKANNSPIPPRSPLSPQQVPSDVASEISSVFDASWPQPPPSPPRLDNMSKYRSSARSTSPRAEPSSFGYPLCPSLTPPHKQSKPFHGSGISSVSEIPVLPQARHKRGPSVKSLKRTLSGEKSAHASSDAIYMTVVKEVA
ncbi:hypothetical protein H0H81_003971 [Sphagnurus paluster]|uniref:Pheromone receptor n=1 Tax=Sphagnurus paluster TaxID=117069 RepID=A0A9P7GSM0_9AGAR|nr:hypothetical protein H0H81_003971 [Sphagnurus paluster]